MRNKILISPVENGFDVCVHTICGGFKTYSSMTRDVMERFVESFESHEIYVECSFGDDSMRQFCMTEGYTPVAFRPRPDIAVFTFCGVLYVHYDGEFVIEKQLQTLVNLENLLNDNEPISKWVYATPLIAVAAVAILIKVFL